MRNFSWHIWKSAGSSGDDGAVYTTRIFSSGTSSSSISSRFENSEIVTIRSLRRMLRPIPFRIRRRFPGCIVSGKRR